MSHLTQANEATASHGERTYLGQRPLTPAERSVRDRMLAYERLRKRLAFANQQHPGSGHRAVPHVRERLTHIICQGCHARSVRIPNTRCLACR